MTTSSSPRVGAEGLGVRPDKLPRLLPSVQVATLAGHLAHFGGMPLATNDSSARALIAEIERAGLRGRGGGRFPTSTKLRAVRASSSGRLLARKPPIVVANGTEGEPASRKDATLIYQAPHLVFDGMVAAAGAVGADQAILCVDRSARQVIDRARDALAERQRHGRDPVALELVATPPGYVVGEETALVAFLNDHDAKPMFTPPRPFERGVDGRATLVNNVETLANIALIARFGAAWWRSLGSTDCPGTMLATVGGAVARAGVYEVPTGLSLADLLSHAGANNVQAVLVGGYFGSWLRAEAAARAVLTDDGMRRAGGTLGCGAIVALGVDGCPLIETTRVARWMAGESAGQCGPCVFGLPAVADMLELMVRGDRDGRAEANLSRLLGLVNKRGACKLPDGVVQLVSSTLNAFGSHIADHRIGHCGATATGVLPIPRALKARTDRSTPAARRVPSSQLGGRS